jgi:hypothetical protein
MKPTTALLPDNVREKLKRPRFRVVCVLGGPLSGPLKF